MIGQQKISAFFKSIPAKKPGVLTSSSASINQSTTDDKHLNANAKLDSETEMAKKRMKSGPCDVGKAQGDGTPVKKPRLDVKQAVSPEQKQRMEDNRMAARMKLAQTNSLGLIKNMGTTWFEALQAEFSKDYFKKLCRFVDKERQKYTIYPPSHQVFSWTQMCDVTDVKVVILGQDPYHGPGQAHGLCFSVQDGVPPPPSLINMYKLLETDIPGFKRPEHGNLTGWAKQGVLLLNACLTVRESQANSHKDQGWEKFTDAVIRWLNNNQKDVVFLLWGSYAQKKGACIDTKKHCVLKGVHPSPLSAHRGFFDCNHFSKANAYLKKKGKAQIDWSNLPTTLL